ncbi:MAG: hypothetical protein JWQ54_1474 [Mucilaginibacter sp.]|nr:hypothetical protein [Mucilaginibacter sp.]
MWQHFINNIARQLAKATQDSHPSTYQRMPSFANTNLKEIYLKKYLLFMTVPRARMRGKYLLTTSNYFKL